MVPVGKTQDSLAAEVGCKQSQLSWWTRGDILPAMLKHRRHLARLLGGEFEEVAIAVERLSELEGEAPVYLDSRVTLYLGTLRARNGGGPIPMADLLKALRMNACEASWVVASLFRLGLLGALTLNFDEDR